MPVVLAVFSMIWEEKSAKDQYGLDEVKLLNASDPLGANPEWKKVRWDVEKAIKEYKETLRNAEEKKEEKS